MHFYVHCSIIYKSQDIKEGQVPINRQVYKKLWYIHTIEYYLTMRINEVLPSVTALQVEPRGYYTSEIIWKRKTSTIWFHIYVESKERNKQNRNRLIDTENRWIVSRKKWVWGPSKKGEGIKYKLVVIK